MDEDIDPSKSCAGHGVLGLDAQSTKDAGPVWVPNSSSTAVTCGIARRWPSGMIAGPWRYDCSISSSGSSWHGLDCWPVVPGQKCGDPGATSRGRRAPSPGQAAAAVLGGSGGVRGTDPATVPGLPAASNRHPRHDLAMAPGPGQATLDPAPPPHRRPSHGTRTASCGWPRRTPPGVTGGSKVGKRPPGKACGSWPDTARRSGHNSPNAGGGTNSPWPGTTPRLRVTETPAEGR